MSVAIGDISLGMVKGIIDDPGGLPDVALPDNPFQSANAVLGDLARRLENLENSIEFKVDSGSVVSAIRLTEEALLIQSDQIGVLGQVTFADYVRDQNGQAIAGLVDPKITQIIADKIRTGSIWSNAYIETSGTQGMVIDLDNSAFYLGGDTAPTLKFSSDSMEMWGSIAVKDRGAEYGLFKTGTADYDGVSITGDGVLVGTPGIFGANSSLTNGYSFALSASTGNVVIGDDTGKHISYTQSTGVLSVNGSIQVGSVIDGGVTIGTKTGTQMIADTAAAQADVDSPSHLSTVLESSSASITTNSTAFLIAGTTSNGVYLGSAGLFGKSGGSTTFSVSATTGDALFAGTVSSTKQIKCISTSDELSTDAVIYGKSTTFGSGVYGEGNVYGVWGVGNTYGVRGEGFWGVVGYSDSTNGAGVYAVDLTIGSTALALRTSGISQFNGNITAGTGNLHDIGSSGTRFKNIYCGNVDISGKFLKNVWATGQIQVSATSDGASPINYYYRFI